MSDKLEVVIIGKNGVSRIFQEVSSDATKMGTGVEASSKKASKSLDEVKSRAVEVGAAFGTALGVTALLGRAYNDQENELRALERSYGDAADEIKDFTEYLQDSTTASNEQARESALIAATLARNYGFTIDEIKQVIQTSADLAATSGLSLADATQRVTAALRGEAEGAEVLGLTLNQQSIDRQNLTLTMTNQEAAHFRLNALLEQSAFAEGRAAELAETNAGKARQWVNELQDVAVAAGGAIGPIGAYASVLGNLAYITPAAGAGIGKLVAGITAGGGLVAALGPIGLAGAALAAGAGILYLASRTEDYVAAADQAAIATDNLENFFASLGATLDHVRADRIEELHNALDALFTDAAKRQDDFTKILTLQDVIGPPGDFERALDIQTEAGRRTIESMTGLTEADLRWIDANGDLIISVEEVARAVDIFQGNLDRLSSDQIKSVEQDIENLLSRPNLDFDKTISKLQELISQLDNGVISGDEFTAAVDEMATHFKPYIYESREAASATADLTKETGAYVKQAKDLMSVIPILGTSWWEIAQVHAAQMVSMRMAADALNTEEEATKSAIAPTRDLAGELNRFVGISAEVSSFLSLQTQRANEATNAIAEYASSLGQTPTLGDSGAARFSSELLGAGAALGSAFSVVVSNTDAIGNQSQHVADWAKELINVRGEHGKIDDLLAKGLITQEQYNKAQSAGTKIFDANAKIQEDILTIQAKQAPIIGQLTKDQQHYMDELAKQDAHQQAISLAYMDSETSAKALAAAQLAASAAAGELGKAGEETATKMITAAAEADPYLRTLLQDMGVISVGADGTITVNFDSVKDAGASLDDLKAVLDDIMNLIRETLLIELRSNVDESIPALIEYYNLLNSIPGHVTTVIETQYVESGDGSGGRVRGAASQAHGGVIPAAHGYAGSGDILVGEFGPELLRRNGGGAFVLPTGATKSQMAMGMGGAHFEFHFHNSTFMGIDDFIEQTIRAMVPAFQLAAQQFYDGQGIR